MASDSLIIYPVLQGVKIHKKYSKAPVFLYEFAHLSQAHKSFATFFGASSADYGASLSPLVSSSLAYNPTLPDLLLPSALDFRQVFVMPTT